MSTRFYVVDPYTNRRLLQRCFTNQGLAKFRAQQLARRTKLFVAVVEVREGPIFVASHVFGKPTRH